MIYKTRLDSPHLRWTRLDYPFPVVRNTTQAWRPGVIFLALFFEGEWSACSSHIPSNHGCNIELGLYTLQSPAFLVWWWAFPWAATFRLGRKMGLFHGNCYPIGPRMRPYLSLPWCFFLYITSVLWPIMPSCKVLLFCLWDELYGAQVIDFSTLTASQVASLFVTGFNNQHVWLVRNQQRAWVHLHCHFT